MTYRTNYRQSQASDSVRLSGLNQAGLEEAEQNYFLKYANSAHSQVQNIQRQQKRTESQINQITNRVSGEYNQQSNIYPSGFSKIKSNQSQVLRELKQQYQILRNLPIDDRGEFQKKKATQYKDSQFSSSIRDERSEDTSSRKSGHQKKLGRDAQILSLQKKQLQIVISNSMKKIQELLTNEMELKKIIHELKLQIDGKGGINNQYENMIRNYKKNQNQLKETIQTLKLQIQRKNLAIKQTSERVAFLEGQKSRRDSQNRSYFDQQRKLDDLLRKQKDKSMNMEIQYKKLQMEFQIFQKDKTSQINRLMKQLQFNSSGTQKQSETIKRLNEQIRIKENRYQMVLDQLEQAKKNVVNAPQTDNKQVLQNLIRQIKGETSNSSQLFLKAILSKIQNKKPDQGLRNQLSNLRMQFDTLRRNSLDQSGMLSANEPQLKSRVRQLQRTIQDEKRQKRMLNEQIQKLRNDKAEIQNQAQNHRRKIRQLKETQDRLVREIQEIGHIKIQLHESKTQNLQMKSKIQGILSGNMSLSNRQGDNFSYEQQNRALKRKIDELQFQIQKANQNRSFNEEILINTHKKELQNVITDLQRVKSLLTEKEAELARTIQQFKSQIQSKNIQIQGLKKGLFEANDKNRGEFDRVKSEHQEVLKAQVSKHYSQIQRLNQKVIQITKSNESLMMQNQRYLCLEKETAELRTMVRKYKHVNESVDHLWEVKEAQYQNISQILSGSRR